MEPFESSPSTAVFPGTFAFEERPSAGQPLHHASTQLEFQAPPVQLGMPEGREVTRKQWESLKSLIERVYILENMSFPYLAKILREEYAFEPTYGPAFTMYHLNC
jgi:hypothetical protein